MNVADLDTSQVRDLSAKPLPVTVGPREYIVTPRQADDVTDGLGMSFTMVGPRVNTGLNNVIGGPFSIATTWCTSHENNDQFNFCVCLCTDGRVRIRHDNNNPSYVLTPGTSGNGLETAPPLLELMAASGAAVWEWHWAWSGSPGNSTLKLLFGVQCATRYQDDSGFWSWGGEHMFGALPFAYHYRTVVGATRAFPEIPFPTGVNTGCIDFSVLALNWQE